MYWLYFILNRKKCRRKERQKTCVEDTIRDQMKEMYTKQQVKSCMKVTLAHPFKIVALATGFKYHMVMNFLVSSYIAGTLKNLGTECVKKGMPDQRTVMQPILSSFSFSHFFFFLLTFSLFFSLTCSFFLPFSLHLRCFGVRLIYFIISVTCVRCTS